MKENVHKFRESWSIRKYFLAKFSFLSLIYYSSEAKV